MNLKCYIFSLGILTVGISGINAQNQITPTVRKNSVTTYTPVDSVKTVTSLKTLSSERQGINIQYIDGLGRSEQTVSVKLTPDLKDLIQPIDYDDYGRESTKYLPYEVHSVNNGAFLDETTWQADQPSFYDSLYEGEGSYAKSIIEYEKISFKSSVKAVEPWESLV